MPRQITAGSGARSPHLLKTAAPQDPIALVVDIQDAQPGECLLRTKVGVQLQTMQAKTAWDKKSKPQNTEQLQIVHRQM